MSLALAELDRPNIKQTEPGGPADVARVRGLFPALRPQLWRERGARLRAVPISGRGELRLEALDGLLTPRTRLVALAHVSNALGTVNPVKAVVEAAHRRGIPVLVDGAQAAPHVGLDV